MRVFPRTLLAGSAAAVVLSIGATAAVAASGGASATPRASGVSPAATVGLGCAGLDQVFQSPRSDGSYPVTIVSNQPDGIAGFAGSQNAFASSGGVPGRFSGGQLSGSTSNYLFSDRSTFISSPGGGGFSEAFQPFSINAPVPLSYTLNKTGPGQYTVGLTFGTDINRQFSFATQCIGESLVGYTHAIGNHEWTDYATYTISVGDFVPDPIIP